jgi:Lsr2
VFGICQCADRSGEIVGYCLQNLNVRYRHTPHSGSDETVAKQVITVLTDDLDGGDADRTIEFGLDGVSYTIDLSEKNAGKLRKALDPYLSVASRVGRTGGSGRISSRAVQPARANRDQNQAIREWAVKNGYEVSDRGRIPSSIVEAFHAKR